MDFDSYSQLIIDSVSETGYERFMPSLCIAGESVELQVLETEPEPQGDKERALDWASGLTAPDRVIFCAYRIGNRTVEIVEISGTEVSRKKHVKVRSSG